MTEDEARNVELVRAIETQDRDALLLTREDRQQAEAHGLAASGFANGGAAGRRAERQFIAARANFAAARLSTRHPGITALLQRSRWPRWIGWVIPLLALIAGFFANEFGTDKRFDLLAVPLLGLIVWNGLVYLWILVAALTGRGKVPTEPFAWLSRIGRRSFDFGTPLHRAVDSFQQQWARLSAKLNTARLARIFHFAAALFALGLIGGIYLRALVIEYRAGWESTFLGPEGVTGLLSLLLAPASIVTGIPIPAVDEIAAMRWGDTVLGAGSGGSAEGVNAAPWLYLYTTTIVGLVVLPRLLLALWQGVKAFRLARNFPMAGQEDFYLRRLMRAAGGRAGAVRITPYAYRPDEKIRSQLTGALRAALGDTAQIRFDEPVEYGAEDDWVANLALDPADDYHIVLFTLSATPEEENHGALASALAARIASDSPGTVLAGLIDESPYRSHFAGQAGLDERVATRISAWQRIMAGKPIITLPLDLSHNADDGLAERLESGLLPDGAMRR